MGVRGGVCERFETKKHRLEQRLGASELVKCDMCPSDSLCGVKTNSLGTEYSRNRKNLRKSAFFS